MEFLRSPGISSYDQLMSRALYPLRSRGHRGEITAMTRYVWRLVEVLLDSGQRMLSTDLLPCEANILADDMRSRMRVVAVTVINPATGEAVTRPSRNLMAGAPRTAEQEHLRAALGG
jgi:hypothetical protein